MNKQELNNKVKILFEETFSSIEVTDVPDISDRRLTHGATGLEGEFTFLYVDLRGSGVRHSNGHAVRLGCLFF